MTKRMLIDATHAEETRVVVVDGTRIEELDLESQSRKQLRGNIYLAKVTRVEPSLQAAFVEYGGNRHGFLAFDEIHPDYYQIPIADREALMREVAEADDEPSGRQESKGEGDDEDDDDDDLMDAEQERRRRRLLRRYKIQEVIKRRQIMLVQVVKEERGNKGAALTTYLSLAGRYCVLMPNTNRGGGISRKITNAVDRKRLKSAAQSLDVPHGMGLIIRTAGAKRTKAEIKRDYDYLLRLWETIREATLKSIAPALIYEEEDLVKRAIRDMYDKDLDGILVEGEAGYREARDFMRMLMPSQAKKIQHYREATPLFVKHKIEDQLAQIHSPVVPLRSGGYLVINQTEALVAIDVNSGKATRERNIEATALKTNLEAAEEACRQLRLRDLAGLIVIDFIDMDEAKNNRAVEKVLKDGLKDDRARVQMGKISAFGLMEISRQRRRMGVLEGATHVCEHCQGSGRVRSVESAALSAVRAIEMEAARGGAGAISVRLSTAVALYILNEKRVYLARLEAAHDIAITITVDSALSQAEHVIERTETREGAIPRERFVEAPSFAPAAPEPEDEAFEDEEDDEEDDDEEDDDEDASDEDGDRDRAQSAREGQPRESQPRERGESSEGGRNGGGSGRRRRRRRGGRRPEEGDQPQARETSADTADDGDDENEDDRDEANRNDAGGGSDGARRRRRGRRGGRRTREDFRPQDPYGWVHPHAGDRMAPGTDPYVWRDPHERAAAAATGAPPPQRPAEPAVLMANPEPVTPPPAEPSAYAWNDTAPVEAEAPTVSEAVAETPAADEPPAKAAKVKAPPKPRASRAKAKPVEEPAAEAAPPVVEAPPAPEPAPAPVVQAAPPAPAPRQPDPAEISTPPAAPKRGWWRRGGTG